VTETHVCEQLAQSRYLVVHRVGVKKPGTFQSPVQPVTTAPSWIRGAGSR